MKSVKFNPPLNKPTTLSGAILAFLLALLIVVALPIVSMAQEKSASPSLFGGDDSTPIEINSDGGIEWQQKSGVFIARQNATATRGTTVVRADELRAYYRDGGSANSDVAGGASAASEIWRLDALGSVTITGAGWKASGGHAIYDVAGAVIVLKDGNPITLVSGDDIITATKQMEFWNDKRLAVARGNAVAVRGDRQIKADVLSAHLEQVPGGQSRVRLIEAFDNVSVTSGESVATSNRAAYDVASGLARLDGAVVIVRGENRLNGCSADFDLGTGISHLQGCPGKDGKKGRVKGVLLPGAAKKP